MSPVLIAEWQKRPKFQLFIILPSTLPSSTSIPHSSMQFPMTFNFSVAVKKIASTFLSGLCLKSSSLALSEIHENDHESNIIWIFSVLFLICADKKWTRYSLQDISVLINTKKRTSAVLGWKPLFLNVLKVGRGVPIEKHLTSIKHKANA